MRNLRILLVRHVKKIIVIVICIISFIVLQQFVNNKLVINTEIEAQENTLIEEENIIVEEQEEDRVYSSSSENIQTPDVFQEFVNYCNTDNYTQAYEILSSDCKKIVFGDDVDKFKSKYVDNIFNIKQLYQIETWASTRGYTSYKVVYKDDNILQSGGASSQNYNYQDIITIVYEDNEAKLNINGFIYRQTIDKTGTLRDIDVTVNYINHYEDYKTIDFVVSNRSIYDIQISENFEESDIYILDETNLKYNSYIHEITGELLNLNSNRMREYNLKFNKIYQNTREIEQFCLSNIKILKDEENFEIITISVGI